MRLIPSPSKKPVLTGPVRTADVPGESHASLQGFTVLADKITIKIFAAFLDSDLVAFDYLHM
jgi:hypothetical protein